MASPTIYLLILLASLLPSPSHSQQHSHEPPSLVALAPPSLGPEPSSAAGGSRSSSSLPPTHLFSSVLPPFAPISPRVPGERCRSDSQVLLQELRTLTLWAAEMFDASAKFPTGILHGSTMEAGNFDECMAVDVTGTSGISSKYCLSTVRLRLPASLSEPHLRSPSFWDRIKNSTIIPSHKRRDLLNWGLCIPSSCSALDLQTHLQHVLEPYAKIIGGDSVVGSSIDEQDGPVISVRVNEADCQRSDIHGPRAHSRPISIGEIIVGSFFMIAFLLVLVGTGYDVFLRTFYDGVPEFNKQGPMEKCIMCFSAYANGSKLLEEDVSDNPLQFLNGAKFYSICLIIMGHRIYYTLGGPILNSHYVEQFYESFEVVFLLAGSIIVDTFFTISGCLLSFILLTEYRKHKSDISLSVLYITRFIRLTPLYMAIVGLYATLLPRIASGPMWPAKILKESERCSKNWWTNLLYINSFVEKQDMCMLQSWYLSSDMQLFIIGAPVALLLAKRPNFGKIVLGVCFAIAAIIPFVLTFIYKWEPILPVYMKTVKDMLASETYLSIYVPTYMRAIPYFIGMWVGYIIYERRSRQVSISKTTAVIGYIFSTIAMLGPILGSWTFYAPSWVYDPLSSAIYASLHRISWAGGLGWGIYSLTTEYGWLFGKFFGWRKIFALGRLTYSVFLVHCGLQLIDVGSIRTPTYVSIYSVTLSVLADTLLSFLLGFTLSLLFEAPIISLQRVLLSTRMSKKAEETVEEVKIGGKVSSDAPPPPYPSQHDNPAWVEDESQDIRL